MQFPKTCQSTNLSQPGLVDLLNLRAVSMIAIPIPKHRLTPPLKFRFALVVDGADSLRNSVVKVLKAHNWFVRGILRAEQALSILAYIPYRLIVVDSELPGICGIDFAMGLRCHIHDRGKLIQCSVWKILIRLSRHL